MPSETDLELWQQVDTRTDLALLLQPDKKPKSGRSLQERLSELEMGGLIELTDKHAKFVVLGSTGRHYTVTLSTGKASCQCVDFRIRKHACKHQRLIYDQLGGEPPGSEDWHQVSDLNIILPPVLLQLSHDLLIGTL